MRTQLETLAQLSEHFQREQCAAEITRLTQATNEAIAQLITRVYADHFGPVFNDFQDTLTKGRVYPRISEEDREALQAELAAINLPNGTTSLLAVLESRFRALATREGD